MTMQPAFAAIQSAGFDVYAPFRNGREPTYAFFTDGTNIGYIQRGDYGGYSLSTVHIANRDSGTGFGAMPSDRSGYDAAELTVDTLRTAFTHAPHWASQTMRNSVRKHKDWATFAAAYWDRALERVAPVSVEAN